MKRFKKCKRLLDVQKAAKVGWFCFRRKPNNPTWSKVAKVHPLENQTCDKNLCVDLQTRKSKKLSILTDLTLHFVSELNLTCILLSSVRLGSDSNATIFKISYGVLCISRLERLTKLSL